MNRFAAVFNALTLEWEKNRRFRFFVFILSFLVLSFLSLEWGKINENKIRNVLDLRIQLQLLNQNISIADWSERYSQVSELLDEERQILWSASSEGLAKAKFQKAAQQFFDGTEIDSVIVEVGNLEEMEKLEKVYKIRARVRILMSADLLLQTMAEIENSAKLVNIERLQLNYSSGRWSAVFVLNAFFEIKGGT